MKTGLHILALVLLVPSLHAGDVIRYDVVWRTPSADCRGSMPLGNGDLGLNAWVEPDGSLRFYISKTDSFGDNARLLKVGRVRISLDPAPPTDGDFEQTLSLRDATMVVRYGDEATLRLWADAHHPVIQIVVESKRPRVAKASIELWRTERFTLPSIECSDIMLDRSKPDQQHAPTVVEPDTVLENQEDRIGWYHRNVKSVGPALTARIQGLSGFDRPDPLLHRTFGAIVRAKNGRRIDDLTLSSPAGVSHRFSVHVLTEHPADPEEWIAAVERSIRATERIGFTERRRAHEEWWRRFWNRSWIHVYSGESSPGPTFIPENDHPVSIGVDQDGGNRFAGEIGRVSVFTRPLSGERIRELSRIDRRKTVPRLGGLEYSGVPGEMYEIKDSKDWSFAGGLTVEAWIKPGELPRGGGRIVDKITAGVDDGFLLDTYPGNSLRLITAEGVLNKENVLSRDEWVHVAAVADPPGGVLRLYLAGDLISESEPELLDEAFVVSRAYALQRFIDACAGRGRFPIKFNGSIFNVAYPDKPGDADYRRWGPGYWWQNTRLPYLSMCACGDFEMMEPLFRMYAKDLMPLFRYRTKLYSGHGGAFIPECIYFWGDCFTETYGWTPFEERGEDKLQSSRWHKWEWVSGPELVWMMLDYFDHTMEEAFLKDVLLPAADEILTFFDQHYSTGEGGKLVMHPSQAAETWWDCTNPMPEVAGLHAVVDRLLALPEGSASKERRGFWKALKGRLPDLPLREVEGARMLAPAERFAEKHNVENPELYAVFPFRLVSFEKPDASLGIEALKHRLDRGDFGWRQDDLFMAYLGLGEDARRNLVGRAKNKHGGSRFPAFWGPNYDWIPDQDHGGVLMKALQAMLLQSAGEKIYLLPAWPGGWNVHFKLRAPYRTTIECEYRDGAVRSLKVSPEKRRGDIIVRPG